MQMITRLRSSARCSNRVIRPCCSSAGSGSGAWPTRSSVTATAVAQFSDGSSGATGKPAGPGRSGSGAGGDGAADDGDGADEEDAGGVISVLVIAWRTDQGTSRGRKSPSA